MQGFERATQAGMDRGELSEIVDVDQFKRIFLPIYYFRLMSIPEKPAYRIHASAIVLVDEVLIEPLPLWCLCRHEVRI